MLPIDFLLRFVFAKKSIETGDNENRPSTQSKNVPTKWTRRRVKVLFSVIYGNFFLGSCYSLMAPIYPAEAQKKGATTTAYSSVFSIYQLTMFLSAIFYGAYMPRLKPGFLMKVGMLISGICVMLFGLLDYAPDGSSFIGVSLFIRFIDALGAAGFLTASYTTLGCELPDIIGRAMAITETAFAFGLAVGPAIGGLLYEVGGFSLPFFAIGACLLTGTAINFCFYKDDDKEIPPRTITLRELLSDLEFMTDIICVWCCFAVIGFNEASLEPHIRKFSLSPATTGMIFLISGITDALSSPVWGYFCEKIPNAQYLIVLGILLFIVSFLIVGPVPFLYFQTNLIAIIVSQFLLGLGMAAVIVCSFAHGMKHFIQKGYPDEVGTYSMTSGVTFSSACLGAFTGPFLGGISIDTYGYIPTTVVIVGMNILVAIICGSRLMYRLFKLAKQQLISIM